MSDLDARYYAALHNFGQATKQYAQSNDSADYDSMVYWQNQLWDIAKQFAN